MLSLTVYWVRSQTCGSGHNEDSLSLLHNVWGLSQKGWRLGFGISWRLSHLYAWRLILADILAVSLSWNTHTGPLYVVWAPSQHGGFQRWAKREGEHKGTKTHQAETVSSWWANLGSHIGSLPLHFTAWKNHRTHPDSRGGDLEPHLMREECQSHHKKSRWPGIKV